MKPFKFEKKFGGRNYSYVFIREDESFIERSWSGLFDGTVSPAVEFFELSNNSTIENAKAINPEEIGSNIRLTQKTPFNQYCINNINREEIAIYLGLIWRLAKSHMRIALPSYYRETTAILFRRPYQKVLWEYKIENENSYQDLGFKIGNSWSDIDKRVVEGGGVFEIASFQDLVLLENSVQRDASSNINLFCLNSSKRKEELIKILNAKEPPTINEIIQDNEIFIDLAVGSDPGYLDVLLIKSKNDIEGQINKIIEEYSLSVLNYEKLVNKIQTLDQFLAAIAAMINLYPGEEK